MRWRRVGQRIDNRDFDAGECRRYLRYMKLETNANKRAGLLRQLKFHARAAWHMAVKLEEKQ